MNNLIIVQVWLLVYLIWDSMAEATNKEVENVYHPRFKEIQKRRNRLSNALFLTIIMALYQFVPWFILVIAFMMRAITRGILLNIIIDRNPLYLEPTGINNLLKKVLGKDCGYIIFSASFCVIIILNLCFVL